MDTYTKTTLTVIAIALSILALKNAPVISLADAQAQNQTYTLQAILSGGYELRAVLPAGPAGGKSLYLQKGPSIMMCNNALSCSDYSLF
jgi:hypothetical protein